MINCVVTSHIEVFKRALGSQVKFKISVFYWRGVVDDDTWLLPSTAKSPVKLKSSIEYTAKRIIEHSSQRAFKMVRR